VILRNLSFTRLVWNRERGLMIDLNVSYLVAQQIHILASPEGISISNQIPEGECRL
jgi:hypothetical protein